MENIDVQRDDVQHILAQRAQLLAQEHDHITDHTGEAMVVFRLGDGCYAIAARWVRELHPLQTYTRLPGTPSFLIGLANVRSRLLSIVDIRPLLDTHQTPPHADAMGLILQIDGCAMILLTDRVDAVRPTDSVLLGLLSQQAGRSVSWVRGLDHRMTVVLDASGLVNDPRLVVDADQAV